MLFGASPLLLPPIGVLGGVLEFIKINNDLFLLCNIADWSFEWHFTARDGGVIG